MDEVQKYIKELEKLKGLAVDQFGNLTSIENDLVNEAFEWLVENIDVKSGEFVITEDLAEQMNKFVLAVVKILNNNDAYQNMLSDYLSNIDTIGKNLLTFQKDINNIDWEKAGLKTIQKAVINGLIDSYTANGLNQHFAGPLRDIIYRNVLGGMSLKEAKKYLGDYILSGKDGTQTGTNVKGAPGKLSRYLTQTAQIGVDAYTGAINTKLYETFTFTGFIMSGSLIETSSKQCVMGITEAKATNGYLTNKQIDALLKVAKDNKAAPLIEGTTKENLDINKFHWGCRHEFSPFIKK